VEARVGLPDVPRTLSTIATDTQRLKVLRVIGPSQREGNDVVYFERLPLPSAAAVLASIFVPTENAESKV
jgi:hypothetical protein